MSGPQRAISVVVADDEPHVVEYLRTVLHLEGFDLAGTASDADGAVAEVSHLHPDVVLLDLHMPGGGLAAARMISSLAPDTRILVFSASADDTDVLPLLQSGIDGYLLKGAPPDRVAEAIRDAVAGRPHLAPEVSRIALGELTSRLHAEHQRDLRQQRERARVAEVIAQRRFAAVFQPVVDLRSGRAVAVEALSRFTTTPPRPPDVWLQEAEVVGLRVPLELALASLALKALPELPGGMAMAINVSPALVMSGRLGEVLHGQPLSRIVLELTEHAPVDDYPPLERALEPWRDGGVRVAVDDAGAGYSGLARILRLRPELIKLDRSLVREIHLDATRQALARAIVAYAGDTGASVVAEGIETVPELETVTRLGVPLAQGFHLGRPRPLDEQAELLAGGRPLPAAGVDLREARPVAAPGADAPPVVPDRAGPGAADPTGRSAPGGSSYA